MTILSNAVWSAWRRPFGLQRLPTISAPSPAPHKHFHGTAKPYVRWWWLSGPYREEDIVYQLEWLRQNGFGGVELAWLYPKWSVAGDRGEVDNPEWLGQEWVRLTRLTKIHADRLGLGCDFTFGSCWPFGGTCIGTSDCARDFHGPREDRIHCSWEDTGAKRPLVLNHLSRESLRRYFGALGSAFRPALEGGRSALFCDSWEIDPRGLWSEELWDEFARRYGYRLEPCVKNLDQDADVRYDYRKFVSDVVYREFYQEFTRLANELGAFSRVQCHGAPTDLLAAYSAVDIPESEALLFPPHFSRIAASAAALSGKPLVSAESFTCLYGFRGPTLRQACACWRKEQTADLKLLADALFAHGVNQIVWHGMPYNPPGGKQQFFASVHVGPDCAFAAELPRFNRYLETVSAVMRTGRTYPGLLVYLPNEDAWMDDELPEDLRTPGAFYHWEMRYVTPPKPTEGYHPLWASYNFLRLMRSAGGSLHQDGSSFPGLYVDCQWLDAESLPEILRLAREGALIVLKRRPRQPGKRLHPSYDEQLEQLTLLPNVRRSLESLGLQPFIAGDSIPPYWARQTDDALYVFFSHPMARDVRFPMSYGQSLCRKTMFVPVVISLPPRSVKLRLEFAPYQSRLIRLGKDGSVGSVDIEFTPLPPRHS